MGQIFDAMTSAELIQVLAALEMITAKAEASGMLPSAEQGSAPSAPSQDRPGAAGAL